MNRSNYERVRDLVAQSKKTSAQTGDEWRCDFVAAMSKKISAQTDDDTYWKSRRESRWETTRPLNKKIANFLADHGIERPPPEFEGCLPNLMPSITTLPNGVCVATEDLFDGRNSTVGLWIDHGSRFECERTNGIGNFIQRMIHRPPSELKEEIEKVGGKFVSYMNREQTAYYFTGRHTSVCVVLGLLANFIQYPSFNTDIINMVKCTLLREIEEGKGQAGEVIFDYLHHAAFNGSSLGRSILGSAENVKLITTEHLEDYLKTNYTAPRVVVSAAGVFVHEEIVKLVKNNFTNLSCGPTTGYQVVAEAPAAFTGSEVRVIDNTIKLAQFAVAFKGAAATNRDSIVLMIIEILVGSWSKHADQVDHIGQFGRQMSSLNNGVESVMAFNFCYKDTGLFGVNAVAMPGCYLKELACFIMRTIRKLCNHVEAVDVYQAREKLKLDLETYGSAQVADAVGRKILTYGPRIPYSILYADIDAVNEITVKRVANQYFNKDVAVAALGPVSDLPSHNWFRYWSDQEDKQLFTTCHFRLVFSLPCANIKFS